MHTALFGLERFNEAIDAFQTMLPKLGTASALEIRSKF
jgi:hypothetical protein